MSAKVNEEIELKLRLDPDQANRFNRHALLRSLAQGRSRKRKLVTTYFDTPDLALKASGAALRVRADGTRRVQCLKVPRTNGHGGAQVHDEHESEVAGDRPEIERLNGSDLAALFADEAMRGTLAPVFTTEIERSILPVRMIESDIEVALDVGEVRAGDERQPICEAELELKSGSPVRLYELALALHESLPVRIERRTKAARGYGLVEHVRPAPSKAKASVLTRGMTVQQAFPVLARDCIEHMLANEAAVIDGGDPEGVHQMRVALRRLRALVPLFDYVIAPNVRDYLRTELRWLQRELGPARDLDVFVDETLAPLRQRLPDDASLAALEARAAAARAQAYDAARAAVQDSRFTTLILRLDVWLDNDAWANRAEAAAALDEPVVDFADRALDKAARRVRKLGRKHRTLGEDDLHKLRLRAKKLRYVAEFFASLYKPKPAKRAVARVRELQEALGSLNDAVVGRRLADTLVATPRVQGGGTRAQMDRAAGVLVGWFLGRIERDLTHLPEAWAAYRKTKPFWGTRG